MDEAMLAEMDRWLAEQSEGIRKLAERFPVGTIFIHKSKVYFLVGYAEDVSDEAHHKLMMSTHDPFKDYKQAIDTENVVLTCVHHFDGSRPIYITAPELADMVRGRQDG